MKKTIKQPKIRESIDRLIEAYKPEEVYIFGSYAWGNPSKNSDVDILIIVEESEEKFYKRPIKGHHSLNGLKVAEDIIIYTRDEFEERAQQKGTLCHRVKQEGQKVYETI